MTQSDKMKLVYRYNTDDNDYRYVLIDAYRKVNNPQAWKICPNCGCIPKVWEFDNGRSTGCGCGNTRYDHFSIYAESIMSVAKHSYNGTSVVDYDIDDLRKNWNHWVDTGEEVFVHHGKRTDDRW